MRDRDEQSQIWATNRGRDQRRSGRRGSKRCPVRRSYKATTSGLVSCLRETLRACHYSQRTEKAYLGWVPLPHVACVLTSRRSRQVGATYVLLGPAGDTRPRGGLDPEPSPECALVL